MLDEFIERWSGSALIAIGVVAVAVSIAGYFYLLPPPFSLPPALATVIGPGRWTFASEMFGLCGLLCVIWGRTINAYFRRDWRVENTTSHLTSAEAVRGAAERSRLRRNR